MKFMEYAVIGAAVSGIGLLHAGFSMAQDDAPIDLSGVWSTNSFDTLENPGWDIVGLFSCRCAVETYELLNTLLNDRANDHMNAFEIIDALAAHTDEIIANRLTDEGRAAWDAFDLADDPAIQCERFPTFRTALHSDPIEFEYYDDHILIKGEDLTVDRTVYTDGRGHPESLEPSSAGHSIGWYEDGALVVETVGVKASLVDDHRLVQIALGLLILVNQIVGDGLHPLAVGVELRLPRPEAQVIGTEDRVGVRLGIVLGTSAAHVVAAVGNDRLAFRVLAFVGPFEVPEGPGDVSPRAGLGLSVPSLRPGKVRGRVLPRIDIGEVVR